MDEVKEHDIPKRAVAKCKIFLGELSYFLVKGEWGHGMSR